MTRTNYTPVRLTPHERAALEVAARKNGGTLSDALRWAIRVVYMEPPYQPTKNEGRTAVVQTAGAAPLVQS